MSGVLQLVLGALSAIAVKLASQAFVEYVLVFAAEILAKQTQTPYDDEFVRKVKDLLAVKK